MEAGSLGKLSVMSSVVSRAPTVGVPFWISSFYRTIDCSLCSALLCLNHFYLRAIIRYNDEVAELITLRAEINLVPTEDKYNEAWM